MQREMPLAPLAWLLGDGGGAISEGEDRGHRVLKRAPAVRSDGASHRGPQRVWRRIDRSGVRGTPRAIVALAKRKHEQHSGDEDDAGGRQPARRQRASAELALLPRGRGGDDRAFAELEPRLDPAVLADPAREHLQLLTAGLEREFGHALRVDDWPRQRCDRQLEADLAFADSVIMLGRDIHD